MYRISIRYHFDAAHFLRSYPGKCSQLHGHRWVAEVVVKGEVLDDLGMLVDFSLIKTQLKQALAEVDHRLINEHAYFQTVNPTAENLARFVFGQLRELPAGVRVERVRVYETPDAWAEFGEV